MDLAEHTDEADLNAAIGKELRRWLAQYERFEKSAGFRSALHRGYQVAMVRLVETLEGLARVAP
jgi:D-hexose-6-phosphate mutarotase